ncbi:MAG: 1-deoxy-D-xylulose-5-phosphate reductoisomerase [Chloroflexi bacterium]|nr:1-deoxy-D-xylulose-5-phosphate reductoisomerase [Chloroflexota bacterium]
MPTRLAILGATGSVGQQTLAVVRAQPDRYRVVALAAAHPSMALRALADEFRPACVVVAAEADRPALAAPGRAVLAGEAGLTQMATDPSVDLLVAASGGHAGIAPTLAALAAGKHLALANKETIVCAGALVTATAQAAGVTIRPVDSEHSAIWQCLGFAQRAQPVRHITLTASGGPFRTWPVAELEHVSAEQALNHPTWRMGGKITVDSASLMNKGLEVIEAHWLFGQPYERIRVLVHPQSIVHSLVEFADGSVLAQLGQPDMRLPIHVALAYPERVESELPRLDLAAIARLDFELPRLDAFPCLGLAYQAGRAGGTYPTVLSAADEVAVELFMAGAIRFTGIPRLIEAALQAHVPVGEPTLADILEADRETRAFVRQTLEPI